MTTCARCGAQNMEGAEFCASCGNSLIQPGAAPGAPVPPPPSTPYAQPPPGQQPAAPPPGAPYQQQPMPYQPVVAPTTNGKATAALVLGIVGIFVCPIICSILALIFGYQARNEIAASGGYQGGDSYATAGIILGWIGLVLAIVWITIWAVAVAVSTTSTLIIPMMI